MIWPRSIPEYYRGTSYLILDGRKVKLDFPEDAKLYGFFKDRMLLNLRTDWEVGGTTYPADALLAIDLDDFLAGKRHFDILFEPSDRVSLGGVGNHGERSALLHPRQRPRPPLPAHSRRRWLDRGGDRTPRSRHGGDRQLQLCRRQLLLHLHRLPDAVEPLLRPRRRRTEDGQDLAFLVRPGGNDRRSVRGRLGGRRHDPLLRGQTQGL